MCETDEGAPPPDLRTTKEDPTLVVTVMSVARDMNLVRNVRVRCEDILARKWWEASFASGPRGRLKIFHRSSNCPGGDTDFPRPVFRKMIKLAHAVLKDKSNTQKRYREKRGYENRGEF